MGPLWTPSPGRVARTTMSRFIAFARDRYGVSGSDYAALYDWSIHKPLEFWNAMWDFGGIIGSKGSRVAIDLDHMPGAAFFPDATLNFSENVLNAGSSASPGAMRTGDDVPAILHRTEATDVQTMTWGELRAESAAFAAALRSAGVTPGDRIAAYMPNVPEAIVAVLGAAAVGAVWSSCSPDFGVQGVLDRFGQIEPRVFLAADRYVYGGKTFDQQSKIAEILAKLPTVQHSSVSTDRSEERRVGKEGRSRWA